MSGHGHGDKICHDENKILMYLSLATSPVTLNSICCVYFSINLKSIVQRMTFPMFQPEIVNTHKYHTYWQDSKTIPIYLKIFLPKLILLIVYGYLNCII